MRAENRRILVETLKVICRRDVVVATGSALCHGVISLPYKRPDKRSRLTLPRICIGAIVKLYILCHIVGVSCVGLIVSDGGNAYGEKQKRTGT